MGAEKGPLHNCFVLLCYTSREAMRVISLFIDPNCTKMKRILSTCVNYKFIWVMASELLRWFLLVNLLRLKQREVWVQIIEFQWPIFTHSQPKCRSIFSCCGKVIDKKMNFWEIARNHSVRIDVESLIISVYFVDFMSASITYVVTHKRIWSYAMEFARYK